MGKLTIVSRSSEPFRDRREAGEQLAQELGNLRGRNTVVLGIPRGGLIIARELARLLDADLDIVIARKLRTPGHPELAMGAVTEGGKLFLNDGIIKELGVTSAFVEQEKSRQLSEIAYRVSLIRRVWPKVPLAGKTAIVTDDGVATGATTEAAIWAVKQEKPSRVVAAIPVGSEETVNRLAKDVDELVCLRTPPFFNAVGQFYIRFDQVDDEDVVEILRQERRRRDEEQVQKK